LLDGGHKRKGTGGPGERVSLSRLQGSRGSGGRRGWSARKRLRGRGMGIWQRLSLDYSWEADSGRFLGWRGGAIKWLLEGPDPRPALPGRAIPRFPGVPAGLMRRRWCQEAN
jgi:hypothetical protein